MSLLTRFQNLAAAGADTNPYEPATHLAFPNNGDTGAPSNTATIVFTEIDYDATPGIDKLTWYDYLQISNGSAAYNIGIFDPKSRSIIQATGAGSNSGVMNLHCYDVSDVNNPSHFASFNNIGNASVGQYEPRMFCLSDTIHHTKKMGVVATSENYAYVYNTGVGTTNEDFNDIAPQPCIQVASTSATSSDVLFDSVNDRIVKTTLDPNISNRRIEIFSLTGTGNLGGEYGGVTYTDTFTHPYTAAGYTEIFAKAMVRGTSYLVTIADRYRNGSVPTSGNRPVLLFDISDPSNVTFVGETEITNQNTSGGWEFYTYTATYDNYVIFFSGDANGATNWSLRVCVVDCSDPANPTQVTSTLVNTASNSSVYYPNWIAWDQGSNSAYVLGQFGNGSPLRLHFNDNGSFNTGNSFYNTNVNTWRTTDMTNYPSAVSPGQNDPIMRGNFPLYF